MPKWLKPGPSGAAIKVILPRPAANGLAPWTPQRPRTIKNSLGNEFRRMTFVESELALLRDPRLAALATNPWPAWLWSTDVSRMLWANAAGAALFGGGDTRECVQRRFDSNSPAAAQIIRLAATLPSAGPPRLERLRGFGLGFGRALTCACSRLVVADGKAAVLVAAAEPAGAGALPAPPPKGKPPGAKQSEGFPPPAVPGARVPARGEKQKPPAPAEPIVER